MELSVECPRTKVFQHLQVGSTTHSQKISIASRCSHADRIPMNVRISAPVQNGPGASCTMDTGSFPGVKWSGSGAKHPSPSSVKVKGRVEL